MPWKPDYCDGTALADYMRVGDGVDAALFTAWAGAASRAVDRHCNRQFGQIAAPAARVYRRPPVWDSLTCSWVLEIDDVQDVTGMTVGGVAYASSGATLLPDNAPADGRPWERLSFTTCPTMPLTVVARWGWSAVPTSVITATKLQGSRLAVRRDSPYGVAGSPESGTEMRLLTRLDPDVITILRGLARRRRPM